MPPHENDELPPAEMEVLALLYREGSGTTRDVCDGLAPHRQMGLSAAQALLLRLEGKGLVKREKIEGRNAYRYTPTRKSRPVYRRMTRSVIDKLFGGSPVRLVSTLFESQKLTDEEVREIQALIEKRK